MLGLTASGPETTGGTRATGELEDSTAMLPQSSGFFPATKLEYFGFILIRFLPDSIVEFWFSVPANVASLG